LVLEQAQEFGEVGAGIQLAQNAWSALDVLGVGSGSSGLDELFVSATAIPVR
jgi:salicylate hydroxylase